MAQEAAWVLHSDWFSLSPKYHGGPVGVGPGVYWAWVDLCHSQGTPNLGNPHSYKGATCPNMPNLCPRGKYLYYTGQEINLSSAPEGDSISVFQGCLFSRHPWKDSPEWKQWKAFAEKTTMEKLLSQKLYTPSWLHLRKGSHYLPVYSSCSGRGINSVFSFPQNEAPSAHLRMTFPDLSKFSGMSLPPHINMVSWARPISSRKLL